MDNLQGKLASLEALLFIHGEPIEVRKLEKILNLGPGEGGELADRFREILEESGRGLRLVSDSDKVQLVTKPEFSKIIENFIKDELSEDLTPASLETLSIVCYLGPISRSRLEYLRGVNSMFTLRSLMLRGLVSRAPDPKRMNAYLYNPSFDLLKHLGLGGVKDLPEFERFNSIAKKFEVKQIAESAEVSTPEPAADTGQVDSLLK